MALEHAQAAAVASVTLAKPAPAAPPVATLPAPHPSFWAGLVAAFTPKPKTEV